MADEVKKGSTQAPSSAAQRKRIKEIYGKEFYEDVISKLSKKEIAELVNKYFPDRRRVLNECQRYAVSGKIDSGI